jgi:hypothetical protein
MKCLTQGCNVGVGYFLRHMLVGSSIILNIQIPNACEFVSPQTTTKYKKKSLDIFKLNLYAIHRPMMPIPHAGNVKNLQVQQVFANDFVTFQAVTLSSVKHHAYTKIKF